jgi:ubiquinone/menaquinone biosynthesis C-methylase UbiE
MANPALTYESFFVPAIFAPCTRLLVEAAAPVAGERVLDLACGTGVVARTIAPIVGPTGKVTGVDMSPDMLEIARSLIPDGASIELRQGDGSALDLPSGSFDLVTCQHGLQFFPDRLAGTRSMRRVVRDGGRALVLCWKGIEHQSLYHALFRAEARFLSIPIEQLSTPFSLGDAEQLRRLLRDGGFASAEVRPYTITASFASADQFVRLTIMAGSAVMPELANDIEGIIAAVQRDCAAEIETHRVGDRIEMTMEGNLAVAVA